MGGMYWTVRRRGGAVQGERLVLRPRLKQQRVHGRFAVATQPLRRFARCYEYPVCELHIVQLRLLSKPILLLRTGPPVLHGAHAASLAAAAGRRLPPPSQPGQPARAGLRRGAHERARVALVPRGGHGRNRVGLWLFVQQSWSFVVGGRVWGLERVRGGSARWAWAEQCRPPCNSVARHLGCITRT